ncbi:MAG TPA: DUF5615 family PIN-like protein [Thermoanaerobaculia bacterium]|nr:DUF5615 family PIN-like protein [Thermoanaerobaculia bacterium]
MEFLADENFPLLSVRLLRAQGLDVSSVSEDSPGAGDIAVLAQAARERRVVLTFDRHFGLLIYRTGSEVPVGLVFLRFVPTSPEEPAAKILELLNDPRLQLAEQFTVIDPPRIRQRPLPQNR